MDLDNVKTPVIKHLDTQIQTNNPITMLEQTFSIIMNSDWTCSWILAKYNYARIYSDLQ